MQVKSHRGDRNDRRKKPATQASSDSQLEHRRYLAGLANLENLDVKNLGDTCQFALPGLAHTVKCRRGQLLDMLAMAIYAMPTELVFHIADGLTDWQRVDLFETILVCRQISEQKAKPDHGMYRLALVGVAGATDHADNVLLLRLSWLLYFYGPKIVSGLNLMPISVDRVLVAHCLPVAESIMSRAGDGTIIPAGAGTAANPTYLQQRAIDCYECALEEAIHSGDHDLDLLHLHIEEKFNKFGGSDALLGVPAKEVAA